MLKVAVTEWYWRITAPFTAVLVRFTAGANPIFFVILTENRCYRCLRDVSVSNDAYATKLLNLVLEDRVEAGDEELVLIKGMATTQARGAGRGGSTESQNRDNPSLLLRNRRVGNTFFTAKCCQPDEKYVIVYIV